MKVTDLPLAGLKLIELKVFSDDRGSFTEFHQASRFEEAGLPSAFVQDNWSRSKPGVVRGLHYQAPQGKLVMVDRGCVWDVVVDIRAGSPTFGKWVGTELNDTNGKMLWIPPGFAHGFCVLGNEDANVLYKLDVQYSPAGEGGIRFDDPQLKIEWPFEKDPIISEKDRRLPSLAEYSKAPIFK